MQGDLLRPHGPLQRLVPEQRLLYVQIRRSGLLFNESFKTLDIFELKRSSFLKQLQTGIVNKIVLSLLGLLRPRAALRRQQRRGSN